MSGRHPGDLRVWRDRRLFGPTSIERWAKVKEVWLRTLLALPNGIPLRDCIRRVLCTLQPEAFQKCFQQWIAADGVEKTDDGRPTVAIDGRTVRRSHDRQAGLRPLHMVSAWLSEQGLSLGQVATEEKSNEITPIPEVIDLIDVNGAVVTIGAMGCQKDIAKKIIASGGEYVLAVKDNQPTLHQAVQSFFDEHLDDNLRNVRTATMRRAKRVMAVVTNGTTTWSRCPATFR